MLSPLLAVILGAAPETVATPSYPSLQTAGSVPATTVASDPQATTTAASLVSRSSEAATGPLVPGSWGLGFRVMGGEGNLLLRRAFTPRLSGGLQVGWTGSLVEDFSRSGSTAYQQESWSTTDEDAFTASVGLPLELQVVRRSPVGFAVSAGPILEFGHRSTSDEFHLEEDEFSLRPPPIVKTSAQDMFGLGLEGSVGLRWYLRPDIALAADYRAVASWIHAESESRTTSHVLVDQDGTWVARESSSTSEFDRVLTRLEFVGVGLEAWF